MLNRTKHIIKLCLSWCLIFLFLLLAAPAKAQFIGLNVDLAIAYSAAPGSVSGGSVGITHPVPLFDLHLSYRSVSSKVKGKGANEGNETDLGGNVMGLGIGFNF